MRAWPSVMTRRSVRLDPDRIGEVAPGTNLSVDRLALSAATSRLLQIESPERWALDAAELHGKIRADGAVYEDSIVVLFVRRGASTAMCGVKLEDRCVFILPPGASLDVNIADVFVYRSVVISPAEWIRLQEFATGAVLDLRKISLRPIRLAEPAAHRLEQELARAAHALTDPDDAEERSSALIQILVASIAEACADAEQSYEAIDRAPSRRLKQALSAQEYIRAHLRGTISVQKLCEVAGASRRQLEYAFQDALGVGPREFIHAMRLNEIRRRLLSARGNGATVTDLALEFGISHLGRFAATYRRLFGESPRETLAIARRRPVPAPPSRFPAVGFRD